MSKQKEQTQEELKIEEAAKKSAKLARFASFKGVRIAGETRKTLWNALAPEADASSMEAYADSLAAALAKGLQLDEEQEAACAGLLHALAAGNQSQVRQLLEGEKGAKRASIDLTGLI